MTDYLVATGIRDASSLALDNLAARLHALPLGVVLPHLVDQAADDVLPHLADQFHLLHTVAWRRATLPEVRRGLIRDAIRRHDLKGTLAGFRQAARDGGGELVRAVTPPSMMFASPSLTREERNEFIARYPQLRVYPHKRPGRRVGMHVGDHLGYFAPVTGDAAARLTPRTTMVRDGVETELTVVERVQTVTTRSATTLTEVRAGGLATSAAFCGNGCRWPATSTASARLYRLYLSTPYAERLETVRRTTVAAGLEPLDVKYDWIAGQGRAQGLHAGRFVAGYLVPSSAGERIYKRVWLFDPAVPVTARGAFTFCGRARLGMPPHHAQLDVAVGGTCHRRAFGRFVHGFTVPADRTDYNDTMEALREVARASDRIAVQTAVIRAATAGLMYPAGSLVAGDRR